MAAAEEEREQEEQGTKDSKFSSEPSSAAAVANDCRKEKRKALKKEKRKQKRKEAAENERQEEEARLNDPAEQLCIQLEEEREKERVERERREFEEKERLFLEALNRRKAQEEEEEEQRRVSMEADQKLNEIQVGVQNKANGEDEWEYVEDGPPEIIWQGNEIIVKKNKVRMKKKDADGQKWKELQDPNRPTSNPLPPQSETFADFKSTSTVSAQKLLENVAQQIPNFGTEQDKAHCPFHLKTGACRFGSRCSRVHFYPDKSCILLIKNMYNGPGLAWEQDEGLEYTDEEVEHSYEEFYEDVHTEFLKFGEIFNFKVCRNGSYHLRGNVYVHYQSLDSAVLAFQSINGRYFAGKLVNCEFVGVTKWKVAICGEYMKSKLKTCSRGTACNFIHCFRNPGGDYEWVDWEKPPPKYWVIRMAALFGYSHEFGYDKWIEQETPGQRRNSGKRFTGDEGRYHSPRSLSREIKCSNRSSRDHYKEDKFQRNRSWERRMSYDIKSPEALDERECEEERHSRRHLHGKKRHYDSVSDKYWLGGDEDADGYYRSTRKNSRSHHSSSSQSHDCREIERSKIPEKISRKQKVLSRTVNDIDYSEEGFNSADSSRDSPHESRDCVSSKDLLYRRRTSDSDSTGDWSDEMIESRLVETRESSKHVDEVAGLSSHHQESGKGLHNKYHQKKSSEHAKSNPPRSRKHTSSGKSDHSSRKTREVDYSDGHEDDNSKGCQKSENVDAREHRKHNHSGRKTEAVDYADKHDEDIDRRGCWESEKIDTRDHHKHKRKSHNKSGSHDQIVSEHSRESGSRTRSKSRSSNRKRKTHSKGSDSIEKLNHSGETGIIHEG